LIDPNGECDVRRRWVIAPIVGALAFRMLIPGLALTLGNAPAAFHEPDTKSYLDLARSLWQDDSFSRHGEPELLRTPGYPLFLSLGFWVGNVDALIVSLQIAIGSLTTVVVYRLAKRIGGFRVGLAAAWCFALEPLSSLYACKLLSETLFTFLLAMSAERFSAYRGNRSIAALMQSAAVLSVAAYVRPVGYYLPVVMAGLLFCLPAYGQPSTLRRMARSGAFLVICAALLIPWQVRNSVLANYQQFSAVSTANLYFWHAAAVRALENDQDIRNVQVSLGLGNRETYFRLHPEQRGWSPGRRYRYMRHEAIVEILDSPLTFAWVYVRGVASTLTDPGTSAYTGLFLKEKLKPAWRKVGVVSFHIACSLAWAGYAILAFVGILLCVRQRADWTWIVLLVVAAYFVVLSGGPVGYHRLRHPIMPLVAVYCGVAMPWLARMLRERSAG